MIFKSSVVAAVVGAALLPVSATQPALATQPAPFTSAAAAPSAQDVAYLRAAHQTNLAEITTGRLATQKGVTAKVRALGARFVTDHTRLDAAVTATAAALGVSLPDAPTPEQQALAARYTAAPPAEFDQLYLTTQLEAHAKSLAATNTEITAGSDPRAKATAASAAPVIAAHHHAITAALSYGQNARSTH